MAFKILTFVATLAVASAGLIPTQYAAPITKTLAPVAVGEDYDPNPQYSYGYEIHDAITGDNKNQQETRNGDSVQGSYSLNDADGFRRTVEYTADPIHGFNAVVHREPLGIKVAAAPIAKVAYSAPVAYSSPAAYAAPVSYAAPIAKVAYSAPVASYAAPAYYHH